MISQIREFLNSFYFPSPQPVSDYPPPHPPPPPLEPSQSADVEIGDISIAHAVSDRTEEEMFRDLLIFIDTHVPSKWGDVPSKWGDVYSDDSPDIYKLEKILS